MRAASRAAEGEEDLMVGVSVSPRDDARAADAAARTYRRAVGRLTDGLSAG